jgi:hypothetical protein
LDRAVDDEGFLERVQLGSSIGLTSQAFYRNDIFSSGAFRRIIAGKDWLAVHQDSATATLGFVAADLCSGQQQPVSEQIGEGLAGERGKADFLTINCKC